MVSAADYGVNNNNFTMLGGTGGAVGGTNLVTVTWDGTCNTDVVTAVANMTMSSASPFFGVTWVAREVKVFGPGSYTFEACPGPADPDTGNAADGSSKCAVDGTPLTMTVGAGQVGAHMLFDWNSSVSIDVVNVWNVDAPWAFSPNNGTVATLQTGDTDCSVTGKGADPSSQACLDLFATQWMFTSDVVDADDISGVPGKPMVDGPFGGFKANFNIQPQVAFDDAATVNENEPLDITNLMDNDLTADVNTIGAFVIAAVDATTAQGGSVTIKDGTTVEYTPPVDYLGADSFTYTIRDGIDHGTQVLTIPLGVKGNYSATATVDVAVIINPNPAMGADSAVTDIDTPVITADVFANDTFPANGTVFTIAAFDTTSVQGGTVTDNGGNTFSYTPPSGFSGADSFTYTVDDDDDDGDDHRGVATVNVNVVDPVPVLTNDAITTDMDVAANTADVFANDNFPENGQVFTITSFDSTSINGGTVVDNGDNTFTYTPSTGYLGTDSFTYTVDDGRGNQATATVNIEVAEVETSAPTTPATSSSGSGSSGLFALPFMLLFLLPLRLFSRKK